MAVPGPFVSALALAFSTAASFLRCLPCFALSGAPRGPLEEACTFMTRASLAPDLRFALLLSRVVAVASEENQIAASWQSTSARNSERPGSGSGSSCKKPLRKVQHVWTIGFHFGSCSRISKLCSLCSTAKALETCKAVRLRPLLLLGLCPCMTHDNVQSAIHCLNSTCDHSNTVPHPFILRKKIEQGSLAELKVAIALLTESAGAQRA